MLKLVQTTSLFQGRKQTSYNENQNVDKCSSLAYDYFHKEPLWKWSHDTIRADTPTL